MSNIEGLPTIVAYIGKAGSGKDYQCKLLTKLGYKKIAFADALRDIAFSSLDVDTSMYDEEEYNHFYNVMKETWDCITVKYDSSILKKFNFRRFLENLGTQGIRKYDNDFWVRSVINEIKKNDYKKVCISDMRFPNEYNKLREFAEENGYVFRCMFCDYRSDRYQEVNTHESARLSNWLSEQGYSDLEEIRSEDIQRYEELKDKVTI